MKGLMLAIFLMLSAGLRAECFMPIDSTWLEDSDAANKLLIKIPNDRNLYISYYNQKNESEVFLAHRHYACDEKLLYVVDEDQMVILYAAIEQVGKSYIRLHFVDNKEHEISVVRFQRI